jgi:hypothetical protein
LSLRDLIDRITGRRRPRRYAGRVRTRSEPTIQLPKDAQHPDAVTARAITAPENRFDAPHGRGAADGDRANLRPYSQPTPPIGGPPAPGRVDPGPIVSPPGAPPRGPDPEGPHAPTQYYRDTGGFKNDEVVAVVVAIDGELKGQVFPLLDGENKMGRATECDLVLTSKWISREHAIVVHNEGVFAIVPLTEKNRTYVNDREVDGAELSDGDTVRLGRTTFRFRSIEGL